MNFYTGIGSRNTPKRICDLMTKFAESISLNHDLILRSGGAKGADIAFERGARWDKKEIFYSDDVCKDALTIAKSVHPAWSKMNAMAQALHARNVYQILGKNLKTPTEFVVCWTPDGAQTFDECSIVTGGTATAIRLAHANEIPVFNLQLYEKTHSDEEIFDKLFSELLIEGLL